ncbi:predicted protein [Histoplasma capsulatum G186AR]|uniref:Uncharacterized protein n=1 Tax=Ajellomyces capsulatus (strain G186AR / H82 / ATCC MYA-2454 / RMSCC 2432) TaxID=447093 RepID=C0P035_AJECG|nr:uncharacterized protein HCBG_08765 [Histoplasma capsulatum G186AR]EEH03125.1 predicted protein [Histoplasma capsulatum G186AR]
MAHETGHSKPPTADRRVLVAAPRYRPIGNTPFVPNLSYQNFWDAKKWHALIGQTSNPALSSDFVPGVWSSGSAIVDATGPNEKRSSCSASVTAIIGTSTFSQTLSNHRARSAGKHKCQQSNVPLGGVSRLGRFLSGLRSRHAKGWVQNRISSWWAAKRARAPELMKGLNTKRPTASKGAPWPSHPIVYRTYFANYVLGSEGQAVNALKRPSSGVLVRDSIHIPLAGQSLQE